MVKAIAVFLAAFLMTGGSAAAENWPQWRGPSGTGVAEGAGFPIRWSKTENVAWKVTLPGASGSTPAVWEDSIFVACPGGGRNLLLCFDRSGKKRWEVDLGRERPGKNRKGSGSNPSPTTDGRLVFAYFKSGDLACLDFDGNVVWRKNLQADYGADTLWWDLGTSPVLVGNTVVVACMHGGPSYVAAFDKETGQVVWKVDRNLNAPVESGDSYTTPCVVEEDGRSIIVVLGADHITAHSAADGSEIWRVGSLNPDGQPNYRSIASPVISDGFVVAPYARGELLTCIRLGGQGDVIRSHTVWSLQAPSADVPTPAAADGRVYVCTDRGIMACLDIRTGQRIWGERLERSSTAFSSSPVLAGGMIYAIREDGTTFVLEQGPQFKLVAKNALDEYTLATPVFVDGQILIRTFESLYCIGEP